MSGLRTKGTFAAVVPMAALRCPALAMLQSQPALLPFVRWFEARNKQVVILTLYAHTPVGTKILCLRWVFNQKPMLIVPMHLPIFLRDLRGQRPG